MKSLKCILQCIFMLTAFVSYSQIITINASADAESNFSLQQLVEDVLIDNDCADITNFSEQTFGQPTDTQTKSYGFFRKLAGSNFPFDEGVVLTTGRAFPAGNTVNNAIPFPDFNNGQLGDADLESALGLNDTNDATFIKFNFVPTSNDFNFRFLMASEEYNGGTECTFADSFAFLLREVGTTAYTNLAVLPNGVPVSVTNINNSNACAANTTFFQGYNLGDTNYGGRTVVLTARAVVIPNQAYEIKIVVADQGDSAWDSAIFLESGSFNIGLDLGDDLTINGGNPACTNETVTLDTQISTTVATHTWFLNGVEIVGETDSTLSVTSGGDYTVEVEYATNCSSTDSILVEFTPSPIANPLQDQFICDTNNDGMWDFDLVTLNTTVLGTQAAADFTISYHINQDDADNDANPLTSPYTNQIAYQLEQLFVRIESNVNPNCFKATSFEIDVFDMPTSPALIFEQCDDTMDGDDTNGFVVFDLSTINTQVLGTQNAAQFSITYHLNLADANSNSSPLAIPYSNITANNQQVFIRIENIDNTNCFATSTLNLVVNPLPTITPIVELKQCDDDTDGLSLFNLNEANVLISNNSANEIFKYYLTEVDAQTGLVANQILNFTTYPNPTALSSFVYVRIETNKGCFRTARINLIVGATQVPSTFQLNYTICDDVLVDLNNTNGVAAFNFSDATAQIEGLFPAGQNIDITYYISLADALAENNPILDISNHRNDASPFTQNIFIRIDSEDVNACLGLGNHITLTVNPLPEQNLISDYILCSDTNEAAFDLTTKDVEVLGTQIIPILISYYESLNDAINNVNPIIGSYLNNQNPRTIFIRSQYDDNNNGVGDVDECFTTDMTFDLIINQNPIIFQPTPIRICNDIVDTEYNLTIRNNEITGNDNTISLAYFESQLDLDNNNPISDPTQYISTVLDNTIFILATGTNGCFSQITMELKTILYSNLNLNPTPIEECEIDNDGFDSFDITRQETTILNGLNAVDFMFTYYENEQDALDGNTNTINNITDYTNIVAVTQIIYVRVIPIANECYQVIPITLIVNPVPEIEIENQYVICLSSTDNVINPEMETFLPNPPIDTHLSNLEYTFQWYEGEEVLAANIIVGATESTFSPLTPGFYTVNATNIASGCTIPGTTEVFGSYAPEQISVEVVSTSFSGNNVLEVTVIGNGTYEFSLDNGVWQSTTTFNDVLGGAHAIRVRDLYNCNELVYDIEVIDYPLFFTPNNDGINDTWNIYGLKNQLDAKIYIFDRYGKLLKQLSPTSLGWDGTYNGQNLSTSDYWFTVEYKEPTNNIRKQFNAHFTLKR